MISNDSMTMLERAMGKIKRDGHEALVIIFDPAAPEGFALQIMSSATQNKDIIAAMAQEALGMVARPQPSVRIVN